MAVGNTAKYTLIGCVGLAIVLTLTDAVVLSGIADIRLAFQISNLANNKLSVADLGKKIPIVNPSSGARGNVTFVRNSENPNYVTAKIEGAFFDSISLDHLDHSFVPAQYCNTRFAKPAP